MSNISFHFLNEHKLGLMNVLLRVNLCVSIYLAAIASRWGRGRRRLLSMRPVGARGFTRENEEATDFHVPHVFPEKSTRAGEYFFPLEILAATQAEIPRPWDERHCDCC